MMRRLVRLTVLTALLVVGVVVAVAAASAARWADALALAGGWRSEALWAGVVMLLLALALVLFDPRPRRRRERFLSFDGEDGVVSISTTAMEDYLARLLPEFPSVVRMQPVVRPHRKGLDVRIDVKVKSGSQVHEMCRLLQQRARERIVDGLGITEVRRIEVSVREIVSEHRPV